MIQTDIAEIINLNEDITNQLGEFDGKPSIFIYRLPQNLEVSSRHLPYIFFEFSTESTLDGFDINFINNTQLIKVIGREHDHDSLVFNIGEKLVNLLRGYNAQSFSILRVSGPIITETDNSLVGTQLILNTTKTL